jgi:hypothetical protein
LSNLFLIFVSAPFLSKVLTTSKFSFLRNIDSRQAIVKIKNTELIFNSKDTNRALIEYSRTYPLYLEDDDEIKVVKNVEKVTKYLIEIEELIQKNPKFSRLDGFNVLAC